MDNVYDIIVVGAGHAGIEAASAAARMGCSVCMMTLRKETVGLMSCNPAVGGVGKGQLVREIDALGGVMGQAADACGMQFRVLNASKGPAVHSSRAQVDMYRYNRWMLEYVAAQQNITVVEAEVCDLIREHDTVQGVIVTAGRRIESGAVILAPGTFLSGRIHQGLSQHAGGRIGEPASEELSQALKRAGFGLMRFKTGTCPRLDKKTIDFSALIPQYADTVVQPFSFSTTVLSQPQIPCHITYTNAATHDIILRNLDRSPLYTGRIQATGVRYCPSIEDKLVRFRDKERHQVFLEPQGYDTDEIYPNGLSTSLPDDVQSAMIRSIDGLHDARIIRFGYGIEHTVIDARQLYPSLESKPVRNLFIAGQINGTTGYEEAAAQGLLAGINAALRIRNGKPFILDRTSSYMGVLIDDLITKGTEEPYRMFTSRVEYRLLIREDNADLRLSQYAYELGLISDEQYNKVQSKRAQIERGMRILREIKIRPSQQLSELFRGIHSAVLRKTASLYELLKRPQVTPAVVCQLAKGALDLPADALKQIEIEVKYAGFMRRQHKDVERFKHLEVIRLAPEFDYTLVPGLSREIQEKLTAHRPLNLGHASRISGVTPAAISILMVYLRKHAAG